jgi:ABC-type protease/lipase transport system fused ATPase/permease subunit
MQAAGAPAGAAGDRVLPSVSNTTLIFFAAGALVVLIVALVALFG